MKSHGIWPLVARKWITQISLILGAVLWLSVIAFTWAEASDEYNFSWLDPDKKIHVLQNRKYLKGERPSLTVMGGPAPTSPYRNSYHLSGSFGFHFSELVGLEAHYSSVFNQENNTFANLKQSSPNALPLVREVRSQFGVNFLLVPWYAKINVFNQIFYFDWYFKIGAGLLRTALDQRTSSQSASSFLNEDLFAVFLGTGHQYHLSQNLFLKLDFSSSIYQAPRFGNEGGATWFSSNLCGIGFGIKL